MLQNNKQIKIFIEKNIFHYFNHIYIANEVFRINNILYCCSLYFAILLTIVLANYDIFKNDFLMKNPSIFIDFPKVNLLI